MPIIDNVVNGGWLPLVVTLLATATVFTIILPLISSDNRKKRLKIITREVDDLRKYEREKLKSKSRSRQAALRHKTQTKTSPKRASSNENVARLNKVAKTLKLEENIDTDDIRMRLARAGYRREEYVTAYLGAQIVCALFGLFAGYILDLRLYPEHTIEIRAAAAGLGGLFGYFLPAILVKNTTTKRQEEILLTFPDALDLLVVCVQSGMTIEMAVRKVSEEMAQAAPVLCEEFQILGAELNYLKERRMAMDNFANRCNIDQIREFVSTMVQAEAYGASILQALRVQAEELRSDRMLRAETKANSLPAKLTVPLALFFLPVVFVIVLAPAIIMTMRAL